MGKEITDKYTDIVTPVGRLVQGDPYVGDTKDYEGNPLVDGSGNLRESFYLALAIEKANPEWAGFLAKIQAKARHDMPAQFGPNGATLRPDFGWKITDGDGTRPDKNGVAWNTKDGFAGHWVVGMKSFFPPACYKAGDHRMPLPPGGVKRGDYIRMAGTVAGNGRNDSPGVYLNHDMIELVGIGEAMVSRPDAAATFGAAAPVGYVPAAAQATPATAAPVQAAAPQPAFGIPPTTVAPVQPAPDFVTNAGALQPQAATAPAVEMFLLNGVPTTRDAIRAMGIPDASIDAMQRAGAPAVITDDLPF